MFSNEYEEGVYYTPDKNENKYRNGNNKGENNVEIEIMDEGMGSAFHQELLDPAVSYYEFCRFYKTFRSIEGLFPYETRDSFGLFRVSEDRISVFVEI